MSLLSLESIAIGLSICFVVSFLFLDVFLYVMTAKPLLESKNSSLKNT